MDKRWRILIVTSLGVFVASLDLFIVNIAFPRSRADFPGAEPRRAVVGAERLRDRLRRAPRAGRAAGRPDRAPADVPDRPGDLHASAPRCARSRRRSGARRRARPAGGRRGGDHAEHRSGSCCPRSRPRSARSRSAIWSAVGGVAAAIGAAARRPAGRGRAGAGSSSSTCPLGIVAIVAGARVAPRDPRARAARLARTRSAPCCSRRRSRCSPLGIVEGPRLGLGRRAGDRRASPARPRPRRLFLRRSRPPPGAGDRALAAARAAGRGRQRRDAASSSPASPRCCWPPSCSSPRSGATRSSAPGSRSRPGPLVAAITAVPAGRLAATPRSADSGDRGRAHLRRRLRRGR